MIERCLVKTNPHLNNRVSGGATQASFRKPSRGRSGACVSREIMRLFSARKTRFLTLQRPQDRCSCAELFLLQETEPLPRRQHVPRPDRAMGRGRERLPQRHQRPGPPQRPQHEQGNLLFFSYVTSSFPHNKNVYARIFALIIANSSDFRFFRRALP